MFDTLKRSEYKVVSIGALASAVRPRIERRAGFERRRTEHTRSEVPTQGYNQENTHCMSNA